MREESNAIAAAAVTRTAATRAPAAGTGAAPGRNAGGAAVAPVAWHAAAWGLLGVLAFSFSLPATRLAVADLDATFVGLGRALVAAVLAGGLLALRREPVPDRRDLPRFAIVGLGVVIGFPL